MLELALYYSHGGRPPPMTSRNASDTSSLRVDILFSEYYCVNVVQPSLYDENLGLGFSNLLIMQREFTFVATGGRVSVRGNWF